MGALHCLPSPLLLTVHTWSTCDLAAVSWWRGEKASGSDELPASRIRGRTRGRYNILYTHAFSSTHFVLTCLDVVTSIGHVSTVLSKEVWRTQSVARILPTIGIEKSWTLGIRTVVWALGCSIGAVFLCNANIQECYAEKHAQYQCPNDHYCRIIQSGLLGTDDFPYVLVVSKFNLCSSSRTLPYAHA